MAAAARDLGEQSGGESFREVLGGVGGTVTADADLQALDDARQVGFVVRGLSEAADQRRGRPHCGESLAPYVSQEQPDAVRCLGRLVEVAADPRLGLRRDVQRVDLDAPEAARQRSQQDLLGSVGHEPDLEEGLLPPEPDVARVGGRQGDGGDCSRRVGSPQVGVDEAQTEHDQPAERAQEDRGEHGPHRGGQSGRGRQEAADGDVPWRRERQRADEDGEDHR